MASVRTGVWSCPFCREDSGSRSSHDQLEYVRKRVERGDIHAICWLGCIYENGLYGLDVDETRAYGLWARAAEGGSIEAEYWLGEALMIGKGVGKDVDAAARHFEAAGRRGMFLRVMICCLLTLYLAMAGCERSRFELGRYEYNEKRNLARARLHWTIAARMGDKDSLHSLGRLKNKGLVSKAGYEDALAGYQNARNEIRSEERDRAMGYGFHPRDGFKSDDDYGRCLREHGIDP